MADAPPHPTALLYSEALLRLGVPHAFTTRHIERDDAAATLGFEPDRLVTVRQVHGSAVSTPGQRLAEADAVVVDRPGEAAAVRVADCAAILLAGRGGSVVAAVHAGWRGIVAGVIGRAVAAMGGAEAAAIGPCIGVEHFEVGQEVAERFEPALVRHDLGPKPHVDLPAAVHRQLHDAGVQTIDTLPACTYAEPERFFSHRRDVTHGGMPQTGRQAAVIGIAAR